MKSYLITAFIGASLLSGCASITKGTDQDINFTVQGADKANCVLSGGVEANIDVPTVLKVDKSSDDIVATCNEAGYDESVTVIESSAEAMTAGNVLFGGFIGLGVDAATGAMFKYPKNVIIYMKKMMSN